MRPMTIDIDELAFALDTPGIDHYLDLYSGKVLLISAEAPDPELDALLENEPERLSLCTTTGAVKPAPLGRRGKTDQGFRLAASAMIRATPWGSGRLALL